MPNHNRPNDSTIENSPSTIAIPNSRGISQRIARARMAASIIGTKKHNDLPEPVPVVTTKLCLAVAFAIACA